LQWFAWFVMCICWSVVEDCCNAAGCIGSHGAVPVKIGCSTKVEPAMVVHCERRQRVHISTHASWRAQKHVCRDIKSARRDEKSVWGDKKSLSREEKSVWCDKKVCHGIKSFGVTRGRVMKKVWCMVTRASSGHTSERGRVGGAPAWAGGSPAEVGGAPAEVGGAPAEVGGAPAEGPKRCQKELPLPTVQKVSKWSFFTLKTAINFGFLRFGVELDMGKFLR